ncbi:MAG TPA: hypothetical protein PLD47_05915, partial [Aggregatilineales bacterium]|nr:hypothetical protein [Aggregatilineales bacterium]
MTTANPNTDWRTGRFVRNVALKTVFLFVAANLAFIALRPLAGWNQPSLYNLLVPGRLRLPFGENPDQSYNLSLQNLPAMLASHALHGTPKAADEYRVILIGDSAVWGVLLSNTETLSAQITA